MTDFTEKIPLGRTGLMVSRLGLSSGYGAPAKAVRKAMDEYGINYFHWDRRKPAMGDAVRELARTRRDEMVITIRSMDHLGFWINNSVEKALRELNIEYADILLLSWHNKRPRDRVIEAAISMKESGRIRFIGFSGHDRKFHGRMANNPDSPFDVQMIRYNAAHRGAETDVFEGLAKNRPGIITYTATRWSMLLRERKMPTGEKPLTASECYRFALTHPAVDICLMGPKTLEEFEQGVRALKEGPLSTAEMIRIHRIGDHVHG